MQEWAQAYTGFAEVYDLFMDDVPYEKWCDLICGVLAEHGICGGLIAELGCGTGRMTRLLAQRGYDMIGIDSSQEMLSVARDAGGSDGILYLEQDMCGFELYGTVAAVVCVCDSVNYLTDPEDLAQMFRLVNNYLDPGGLFIFDCNTVHKYRDVLGCATFAENAEDASYIWENFFDEESMINEYCLTIFERRGEMFERYREVHYERAYEREDYEKAAMSAGMELVRWYGDYIPAPPDADSERMVAVFREHGKA